MRSLLHQYKIKIISEEKGFRCRLFFIDWERDCGLYSTETEAVEAGTWFLLHHWKEHEKATKKNQHYI